MREVDRRLRLCKNPEKVPGTRAYLARQAEVERKAQELQSIQSHEDVVSVMSTGPYSACPFISLSRI